MLRHRGKATITTPPKNETKIEAVKEPIPLSHDVIKPIVMLSLFVGYMPKRFKIPGIFGGLLWMVSLFLHTAWDFMSARKKYDNAWFSIQILLFINLIICTYSVRNKVVPWLERSVFQLDKEHKYLKTFARIRKVFRVIPWVVIVFSFLGTALQFFCFYYDNAFSVGFEQPVSKGLEITLLAVWFLTNVHMLFAFSFFWCVMACNMYTTGYSMTEYHEMMTAHLKNKVTPITFRQAVHSFAERGTFLRKSSSACRDNNNVFNEYELHVLLNFHHNKLHALDLEGRGMISLAFLVVYSIASLAVNAFYYLYKSRKAGYIFFALMPLICSVYPLCLAAWVTKQYKWYLAVVVKAWAERPESTDEEEESGSDQPRQKHKHKNIARKFTKRVKSARRKQNMDESKPRRRSIFALAKSTLGSGSLSDTENSMEKKKDNVEKPKRRSLFVRAKPPLTDGSHSDTEGYPNKEKPRRSSLFVRPKSASRAPFFENEGFSLEKKINFAESPRTKKKFQIDKTQFTSVSDTEMNSEEVVKPRPNELKPRTEKTSGLSNPGIRINDRDNWNAKQRDVGDTSGFEMLNVKPANRLKPLDRTPSISENEELTKNEIPGKQNPQNMTIQNRLKPLDIKRSISENEATDDENQPSTDSGQPKVNRLGPIDKLKPTDTREQISEDEATDDEKTPNTNDSKTKVNRQRVMELILRGTARAVGRLQHRAKMPKFNFEKYISFLQNVLPTVGFKIMGITVTWDMVSTLLFLEVSLLALFMQESIFGNQTAKVAL